MNKNTLVVGIFAGCMLGFILAMLAGAFGVGTIQSVPAWLQGVFSGFAAFVSVYAVFLVSETLQATRKTLDTTQAMAEDQRKIGNAQTRPWILVSDYRATPYYDFDTIMVTFKNYGNTPATSVLINAQLVFWKSQDVEENNEYQEQKVVEFRPLKTKMISALPPNTELTWEDDIRDIFMDGDMWAMLEIDVSYVLVHDESETNKEFEFEVKKEGLRLSINLV